VLARLRERLPSAQLVVTGPLGPHNPANVEYFERLCTQREKAGLQDAARFLAEHNPGYLPDAVISDFYSLADVVFLPSREEGFGIPILEAGIAGVPVFCADIPPLRALGGNHVSYFSADADPAELAASIVDYLSADPVFALRCEVRKSYTWEQVFTGKILPLLESKPGEEIS
jgi:mannosylglucosylglycerate synthase